MTWKVFGGKYESVYLALLRPRCHKDGLGLDDETLATRMRLEDKALLDDIRTAGARIQRFSAGKTFEEAS